MTEDKKEQPKLEDFDVEPLFEDRVHQRHAFTCKVQGDEFKGHYHEGEIQWLHPHPKQMIGESKVESIETMIHSFMGQHISKGIKELQVTQAFEDRVHERTQVTIQVQDEEYKGFVHNGEIQWLHPHPQQRLDDQQVQAIESEIHEKIAIEDNKDKDKE